MPDWIPTTLQVLTQLSVPAIAVTLILAVLGARRRRRDTAAERRRAVVVRVLDSLEATVRHRTSISGWFLPQTGLEWALVYPRLLLELDRRDQAIAGWLWRQVQRILVEPNEQEQVAIASRIGAQVLAWQQDRINAAWFEAELQADPVQDPFVVPRRVQRARALRQVRAGLISGGVVLAGRWAWQAAAW